VVRTSPLVRDLGGAEPLVWFRLRRVRFSGTAHGVGRGAARTGGGITGIFSSDATIDLAAASATITITHLLSDGVNDVSGLPLTLHAECCNNAKTWYFSTAVGIVPFARASIHDRGRDEFTFLMI
jgi:hypothetical protein